MRQATTLAEGVIDMKNHRGCKRQFVQTSKAWHAKYRLPDGEKIEVVTIGFFDKWGGTTGAFEVLWEEVDMDGDLVPKLCAYDDSWNALYEFRDMLKFMASIDDKKIGPDEFCKKLLELGIEDSTPLINPCDKFKALSVLEDGQC